MRVRLMKTILPIIAFSSMFMVTLLVGCEKQALGPTPTDNQHFEVERLFTVNGCTVYRFEDANRGHYFSSCKGSTASPQNCGKGCVRDEEIPTGIRK